MLSQRPPLAKLTFVLMFILCFTSATLRTLSVAISHFLNCFLVSLICRLWPVYGDHVELKFIHLLLWNVTLMIKNFNITWSLFYNNLKHLLQSLYPSPMPHLPAEEVHFTAFLDFFKIRQTWLFSSKILGFK